MCMPFDRRLQIRIDAERHRRLIAAARERGVSVAAVVREAIDRDLSTPAARRRRAARRLLDAPDMEVPSPQELSDELEDRRPRRPPTGATLKDALRRHRPDPQWAAELRRLRDSVGPPADSWRD